MPDSDRKKQAGAHEEEHVRRRAYDLWEREGRPHGRHEHHWHTAKEEVSKESRGAEETQAVPATRVSPSPSGAGSTRPQEATTRSPAPGERSSGTEADPLGLVQGESAGFGAGMSDHMVENTTTAPTPAAKPKGKTAKPRASRAKKPAGNAPAPDRPDRPRH